ncbi:hypothetical protein PT974_12196 [Cladobotryum mycophilum]|uniref:F-box domain-containing protein n=1 Tax=Cladobotryum mycophilum TaxID=491253 RepID=A0ABR0S7C0_9HYPO
MVTGARSLPAEIRLAITQELDPLSASSAVLACPQLWLLSDKKKHEIRSARIWGSIFKPRSGWENALSHTKKNGCTADIVLEIFGDGVREIWHGRKASKDDDPLRVVLMPLPLGFDRYFRPHDLIQGGILISKFNIAVYLARPPMNTLPLLGSHEVEIQLQLRDLWKLGVNHIFSLASNKNALSQVKLDVGTLTRQQRTHDGYKDVSALLYQICLPHSRKKLMLVGMPPSTVGELLHDIWECHYTHGKRHSKELFQAFVQPTGSVVYM